MTHENTDRQVDVSGRHVRAISIEKSGSDFEDRTLDISVSSTAKARQIFGDEILEHDAGNVNLEFFNSGDAPLLLDHDPTKHIGVVERAYLENKRLRAVVRFGKSPLAREIMDDVKDAVRRNISVGYSIEEIRFDEDLDAFRVVSWTPHEVSIVSIPADPSVGTNRQKAEPSARKEHIMSEIEEKQEQKPTPVPAGSGSIDAVQWEERLKDERKKSEDALAARNSEVAEMTELGQIHNQQDLARKAIKENWSQSKFTGELLKVIETGKPIRNVDIGMTTEETKRFSFARLFRAHGRDASRQSRAEAQFEFDAISAALEADHKENRAKGLRIPAEVMRDFIPHGSNAYRTLERSARLQGRTLLAGTDTQLVPEEHRGISFIDALRNISSVMTAGPTILEGLQGNIDIPAKSAVSAPTWVSAEHGDATESEPSFRDVELAPKDLAVYLDISRRMRQQSSPDIENLSRMDMVTGIGLGLDLAALEGTAANGQPRGVLNQVGINKPTAFAAANPTWAEVVAMETAVADDNALMGNLAYIGRTNMRGALKTTSKAGTEAIFVMNEGNELNGYPYIPSNQGTDGNLYFGNWSDVLLGFWSGLDLQFDEAALALKGGLRLIAFQTMDVAVRHPQSFAYNNDT